MTKQQEVHKLRQDLADLNVVRGDMLRSVGTVEAMIMSKREMLAEMGEEEVVVF